MTFSSQSLTEELAEVLPHSSEFTFYHISTPPSAAAPLYNAPPNSKPEKTYCESHFLTVSIRPDENDPSSELLVLAIECLIYTTKHLTTIFVSKADSTGYLSLLHLDRSNESPLRTTASTFVSYLIKSRIRPNVKLVIDLFARASDQYLFPGSVENPKKHVSDDRQLVKWWCRVLDPILQSYAPEVKSGALDSVPQEKTTAQAYLTVPGEETILSFLPDRVRYNPEARLRWKHGHPLRDLATNPTVPPRCLIPSFPDDPKGRFLTELDDELPDAASHPTESPSKRGNGEWRSVKSLEQFWETMAFRSECSSGRLVGFIWIVFTPPCEIEPVSQESGSSLNSLNESQQEKPSETSKNIVNSAADLSNQLAPGSSNPQRKETSSRRRTGPIVVRPPRIKSARSDLSKTMPEKSRYYLWPVDGRGELVLDEKKYEKATEILLRLDFSDQSFAAQSTRTWIDEVEVLGGEDNWGKKVIGKKPATVKSSDRNSSATTGTQGLNVLNVKRKSDAGNNGVNVLNVRKKSKLTDEVPKENPSVESAPVAAPVNVLGAGLVRKKPKKVQPTLINGESK